MLLRSLQVVKVETIDIKASQTKDSKPGCVPGRVLQGSQAFLNHDASIPVERDIR
jgi:hypothetical protein